MSCTLSHRTISKFRRKLCNITPNRSREEMIKVRIIMVKRVLIKHVQPLTVHSICIYIYIYVQTNIDMTKDDRHLITYILLIYINIMY